MSDKAGSSKVKAFIGQTPKNLKQKFFSVLGSSSEYKKQLISGISHKIDVALSFGSTSTETPANENEAKLWKKLREQHEKSNNTVSQIYSLDDHIIDYELRRVKERRAHEELLSGRYRQPAFIAHESLCESVNNIPDNKIRVEERHNDPVSPSIVLETSTSTSTHNNHHNSSIDNSQQNLATTIINHHPVTINKPSTPCNKNALSTKENNLLAIPVANSCSSATSENGGEDNLSLCEGSIDSLEVKMWHKSETESVAPSCSSLSMDSSTDEVVFEFMRRFVTTLFSDSQAITLEFKHQFGQYARIASGRMLFARFVSSQRTKTKRVGETTFYALIQCFSIVLFECKECEDFMPAKHLMSLCFTFYQEVDVPGCEPYREYLFNYLRDQPIWHSLRFWNAALFYALQKDKVPKMSAAEASSDIARKYSSSSVQQLKTLNEQDTSKNALAMDTQSSRREPSRSISESSLSIASSTTTSSSDTSKTDSSLRLRNATRKVNRSRSSTTSVAGGGEDNSIDVEEQKLQENTNIAFTQLGSLTCNMHAFGLNRDLCCEFLKKQCRILNITKEQEKLLHDNVTRLYRETDPWREQVHQKLATNK